MTATAEFLRRYQSWRRGNTEALPQPDPREVGDAIDAAIAAIEERDALRVELAYEEQRIADLMSSLNEAGKEIEHLRVELDALKAWKEAVEKQAPHSYIYRYADPLTGAPVWRHDSRGWNGQIPGACMPLYARPVTPAPSVPERITPEEAPESVHDYCYEAAEGYADGWNDCIRKTLAAAPKPDAKP